MFDCGGSQLPETTRSIWNGKFAGQEALYSMGGHGYLQGRILYRRYLAHRVVWAMHHGEWPNNIDHINHDKTDNRIENLRDVPQVENCRNMSLSRKNTSGACGVSWHKANKNWVAYVTIDRQRTFLGSFERKKDAIRARAEANLKWDFHNNHGLTYD
jgi:hypothetical protein